MRAEAVGPDFGSAVFDGWRADSAEAWRAFTHHPFVEGLDDGTLPRAAFLHYLVQDYIFLKHFARAWALAIVKAETLAEMKIAATVVNGLIHHEMQLHVEVCAGEGLSEESLLTAEEAIESLAYTRYVMDVGFSGDFLDLMAALAPCVLGYGEIGARLGALPTTDNPYRDWIATYAGEEYQSLCRSVGTLIDAAAAARVGAVPAESPRWPALIRTFRTATQLEVGFWTMGLRGGP